MIDLKSQIPPAILNIFPTIFVTEIRFPNAEVRLNVFVVSTITVFKLQEVIVSCAAES